ncbi:MAG TPA: hypothetical protein VGB77_21585 [Abditibacteriaceae bacterium]|jgi:hypothetical protein
MAEYTHFTHEKKEKFLQLLADGVSITRAAEGVDVHRVTAYHARENDVDFAAAWDAAIDAGADRLEDEALRRAIEGEKQYKFTRSGDPVEHPETGEPYFERKYSDGLLVLLLKSRRPEKYRDNVKQETEHIGAISIKVEYADVEPPE